MARFVSVLTLLVLCFVYLCSAQEPSATPPAKSSIGIDGPIIGGDGNANYIAVWRTSNYLQSSVLYQTGGKVGLGTTSPQATLDVNGTVNSATTYKVGGNTVLSIGSAPDQNIFLGIGAGSDDIPGQGAQNTFAGFDAGLSNTSGSGNTFTGWAAGANNTSGLVNTFNGFESGYQNITGTLNVFTGYESGLQNTVGFENTFTGGYSGVSNSTGNENTFAAIRLVMATLQVHGTRSLGIMPAVTILQGIIMCI